jgi:hypothetical protein
LRYECLDARDDYSAQLRKGELITDSTCPQFMTIEMVSHLDKDHIQDGADFGNDCDTQENTSDYSTNKYSELGAYGLLIKAQMDATETIVRNIG